MAWPGACTRNILGTRLDCRLGTFQPPMLQMAALPKNNLSEQLALYSSTRKRLSTGSTPLSSDKKKSFTFHRINQPQASTPPFQTPPPPHNPLTKSHSDNSLGGLATGGGTVTNSSQSKWCPPSSASKDGGGKNKITSFFGSEGKPKPQSSPPIAFVAPVVARNRHACTVSSVAISESTLKESERAKRPSVAAQTVSQQRDAAAPKPPPSFISPSAFPAPPGSSLAGSVTFPPITSSSSSDVLPPDTKAVLQSRLEEVYSERLRVMDEICELLSDIPASKMTSLFGLTAGHVQKKLAVRKQLLGKEQELRGKVQASPAISFVSPSPLPRVSTHSTVIATPFEQLSSDRLHSNRTRIAGTAATNDSWECQPDPDAWDIEEDAGMFDNPCLSDEEDFMLPPTSSPSAAYPGSSSHQAGLSSSASSTKANGCTTNPSGINVTHPSPADLSVSFKGGLSRPNSGFEQPRVWSISNSPPTPQFHSSSQLCHTPSSLAPHPGNPSRAPAAAVVRPSPSHCDQHLRSSADKRTDNAAEFRGAYAHTQEMMKVFTQVFGLKQFRPNQLEAINAAILGQDCFVLMPTGGGKSLCYQLPALMVPGVTVVVSPLRSLIQDQVQKLCSLEIPANHLSSDISLSEEQRIYASLSLREPTTRLLYVTPEKLSASNRLLSTLHSLYSRGRLARFVIDEAHCISQWGHDFRPDYKRLSELREKFPGVPMVAVTATATPRVRADIIHQLHLRNTKWFTQSFNRSNLQYRVVPKKPKKVTQDIIETINGSFRGQSGIVYCLSRRDCELMAGELCKAGITAQCYHAGLSNSERSTVQQRWLTEDRCKVVCATIAFGMGIDKPDVRFVIHHSLPKSVEGYYQEAGRAGRDGRPASCILFYAYSDMGRLRRMIKSEKLRLEQERVHLGNLYRMVQYCENEADCRRVQLLEYFAETFDPSFCKNGSTPCDNCQSRVPFRSEDVTELVRAIVQSVQCVRSDQFTLVQLLDAVKGSTSNRIMNSDLSGLPLYGKGKDMAKHDLERLLHMLVIRDMLAESLRIGHHDNVICYVKAGSKAREFLSGSVGGIVLQIRGKLAVATTSKSAETGTSKEDQVREECYKALLRLRITFAQKFKMKNPEHVFGTATLREMSRVLPSTKKQMMKVVGVTEAKWKNFDGEEFLKITTEYGNVKSRSPYWEASTSKENRPPPVGSGKRKKKQSSSGPKSKKARPANRVATRDAQSEDEFMGTTEAGVRRPGFLPPPRPMQPVRTIM